MTAFMIFSLEIRPQIQQMSPQLSVWEIAREIGIRWKNLPDIQKAPYIQQYKNNLEKYNHELEICKPQ